MRLPGGRQAQPGVATGQSVFGLAVGLCRGLNN